MELSDTDISSFQHAVRLALAAEKEGNLPIGAVITLEGEVIAAGQNAIWHPKFSPNRHAEIEALRDVPEHLWTSSRQMTLYTTLEPCLMCLGAILLHSIGRVVYGTSDDFGGGGVVLGHMSRYFQEQAALIDWIGPAYTEACDALFERVMHMIERSQGREL